MSPEVAARIAARVAARAEAERAEEASLRALSASEWFIECNARNAQVRRNARTTRYLIEGEIADRRNAACRVIDAFPPASPVKQQIAAVLEELLEERSSHG